MAYFPEVDKKTTRDNVDDLLKNYRRMARIVDEDFLPKMTATYSFELKSFTGSNTNQIEEQVTRKIWAEQEIYKITTAMNKLNAYDRQMIFDKYMDKQELTNTAIWVNYHMSESNFYRALTDVLIKFAEAFDNGSLLTEFWQ